MREERRRWAEKETEVELRKHDENESDARGYYAGPGFVTLRESLWLVYPAPFSFLISNPISFNVSTTTRRAY